MGDGREAVPVLWGCECCDGGRGSRARVFQRLTVLVSHAADCEVLGIAVEADQ